MEVAPKVLPVLAEQPGNKSDSVEMETIGRYANK
jgi:hypothetical protein